MERNFKALVPRGHVAFVLVRPEAANRPIAPYWPKPIGFDGKPIKGGLLAPTADEMPRKEGLKVSYRDLNVFAGSPYVLMEKDSPMAEFLMLSPENADSPTSKSQAGIRDFSKDNPDIERFVFYTFDPEKELEATLTSFGWTLKAQDMFRAKIASVDVDEAGRPAITFLGVASGKKKVGEKTKPDASAIALLKSVYTIMLGTGFQASKYLRDNQLTEEAMASELFGAIQQFDKAKQFVEIMTKGSDEIMIESRIHLALSLGVIRRNATGAFEYENQVLGSKSEIVSAVITGQPESLKNTWAAIDSQL